MYPGTPNLFFYALINPWWGSVMGLQQLPRREDTRGWLRPTRVRLLLPLSCSISAVLAETSTSKDAHAVGMPCTRVSSSL